MELSLTSNCRGIRSAGKKIHRQDIKKSLRHLAEAIILQAIEDLWNPRNSRESIMFFKGSAFRLCAGIAGMSYSDKIEIFSMLSATNNNKRKSGEKWKKYSLNSLSLEEKQ